MAIDLKELRIGNIILDRFGRYITVSELKWCGCRGLYKGEQNTEQEGIRNSLFEYADMEPISISPELLIKLGFTKDKIGGYYVKIKESQWGCKIFSVSYNTDGSSMDNLHYCFLSEYKLPLLIADDVVTLQNDMKWLHEIQNMYFAVTKIELDVKNILE